MIADRNGVWVLYSDIAHLLVEEKFTPTNKQSTPCQPPEFHVACRIAGVAVCPKCGVAV
jgi:hypothetical protein